MPSGVATGESPGPWPPLTLRLRMRSTGGRPLRVILSNLSWGELWGAAGLTEGPRCAPVCAHPTVETPSCQWSQVSSPHPVQGEDQGAEAN